MKQIANSVESSCFHMRGTRILNRRKTAALGAIAILCLIAASTSAFASCGLLAGGKSTAAALRALAQAGPGVAGLVGQADDFIPNLSVVGLWHTVYTAGGATFAESFKVWHSDGTELDNIDQNPALGSICLGVWKQTGLRGVRLHHVGWVFGSDGSPAGSFTIDETDTIALNGMSYSGTFTFRTYDVNGNYTGVDLTGTIAATRITVN